MKSAVYAGTFDPITNGHLDIVARAASVFDKVYVAVAASTNKNTLFDLEKRKSLAEEALVNFGEQVEVQTFNGLLVSYVKEVGASVIVRGLRAVVDFEYEAQISLVNRELRADIETVFFMTSLNCSHISSSIVKDVAKNKGDVSTMVPENVAVELKNKFIST